MTGAASAVLLSAVVASLLLAGTGRAQRDPDVEDAGRIVMQQLEAFRHDDFETAFTFASRTIHDMFDTARFEVMVRGGYPEIARSVSASIDGSKRGMPASSTCSSASAASTAAPSRPSTRWSTRAAAGASTAWSPAPTPARRRKSRPITRGALLLLGLALAAWAAVDFATHLVERQVLRVEAAETARHAGGDHDRVEAIVHDVQARVSPGDRPLPVLRSPALETWITAKGIAGMPHA